MKFMPGIALLFALTGAAQTVAVQTTEAVDAKAAATWFAQYRTALNQRDNEHLARLVEAQAPVVVFLAQDQATPLRFTLTRDEYLQQTRALWRFSSADSYTLSKPEYEAGADGSLTVVFEQREQHVLFGTPTGQNSVLRVRLARQAGALHAIDINSRTTQW